MRKTNRSSVDPEERERAITAVLNERQSIRAAAQAHNVPVRSLERYVHKRKKGRDFKLYLLCSIMPFVLSSNFYRSAVFCFVFCYLKVMIVPLVMKSAK